MADSADTTNVSTEQVEVVAAEEKVIEKPSEVAVDLVVEEKKKEEVVAGDVVTDEELKETVTETPKETEEVAAPVVEKSEEENGTPHENGNGTATNGTKDNGYETNKRKSEGLAEADAIDGVAEKKAKLDEKSAEEEVVEATNGANEAAA